ncbi:MAG: HigA family addiction module antidote protein [Alphaproteobacteria bacterium]|nr:HigA family addiction module antidote protein [Alphaproteobacteria bacterium]
MRIRTHPGEVLVEEFMKPVGLSSGDLAMALRIPPERIEAILRQRRGISADMAKRLSRHFGTTPRFWLNLQRAHSHSNAHTSIIKTP